MYLFTGRRMVGLDFLNVVGDLWCERILEEMVV